jgi:transposase
MAAKGQKKIRYSEEYKLGAVRMHTENGKSMAAVARELGVGENTIRSWVHATVRHPNEPFVGKGHLHKEDAERKALERENRELREENAILKKAAAIFAKCQK